MLSNILIQSGDSSSQIDHIVICSSGVFVIETKHYKGWIHDIKNLNIGARPFSSIIRAFKIPFDKIGLKYLR